VIEIQHLHKGAGPAVCPAAKQLLIEVSFLESQNPDELIQRVAVLGGDGGKFYPEALKQGAQVYVTGDVYYHTAHDMLAAGLSVVDPGHHIESICQPYLTALFKQWQVENNWSLEVVASTLNTDPFTFI